MNVPEIVEIAEADIVREYRQNSDVKSIAKQYGMNTNKVKGILRRAGVLEDLEDKKPVKSNMKNLGMCQKDFFEEV